MLTWRDRDAALIQLATRHVCRSKHFFRFFTSPQAAYRRIEKLRDQGLLRLVATLVVSDSGRPEHIFCNGWKPKYDQLRHELLLTDVLLSYPEADTLRGWAVNRRLRPDAEMTLDGYFYFVELDTGEQSYAQVRRRQARYSGIQDFVLYVTLSQKRLEGLVRHAHEAVKKIALFTTLDQVLATPHGEIWVDCFGQKTSI
jgi:hypothetical protein